VRLAHPVQSGQTIRSAQFLTPTKTAPWHLQIPAIDLTAPVIGAELTTENAEGGTPVFTWTVPDYAAAGWHVTSAPPGKPGNTVLNGHNNIKGEVFRDLVDVQTGDRVILDATGNRHEYLITDRHIVREAGASLETRIDNARWVAATADERLTLVTCWPPTGDSHRLIVIARPIRSPVKPWSSLPTMR
jgi:sortase A